MGNGSISEAHTGVIPASSPPKGKPPEPSNRLPRVKVLFVMGCYLAKIVFLAVTQNADLFIRADLFDVSADNDIAEFLVQFDGATDAVGLLTGNERRTGAAEGVKYHGVSHRAVLNGIGQKRDGFHGGVVAVFLGLVKLPDGGLFAPRIPLVLTFLLPTVETRLMLPLVRGASQHEGLLLPDTAAGEVEPGCVKCPAEIQSLGVSVKAIY